MSITTKALFISINNFFQVCIAFYTMFFFTCSYIIRYSFLACQTKTIPNLIFYLVFLDLYEVDKDSSDERQQRVTGFN